MFVRTLARAPLLPLLAACVSHAPVQSGAPSEEARLGVTPLQKKKAEMLTSLWENGTTVLKYAYCENIGDGRGYTSGRAGFCTGTGDALEVVRCFDASFGNGGANRLHKYLAALTVLNDRLVATGKAQADTSTLDTVGPYAADWGSSAADPSTAAAFNACQDQITSQLYFKPSLEVAKRWGLTTALTKAALYDAEINHGPIGVDALAAKANADTGNAQQAPRAPLRIADESAWLRSFLGHRAATLSADKTWTEAVDRAAEYEKMRRAGNWELAADIVTDAKAYVLFPEGGYKDSGYPVCTIRADGSVRGEPACTK